MIKPVSQPELAQAVEGLPCGASVAHVDEEVKMFAQRMLDEHSKMGEEIEVIAEKNKLALPTDIESGHKKAAQKLEQLSGEKFDREFIAYNVKEHEKDIQVFRHCAEQDDKAVRAMAEKGVAMLEQHLRMAREIREKLGA